MKYFFELKDCRTGKELPEFKTTVEVTFTDEELIFDFFCKNSKFVQKYPCAAYFQKKYRKNRAAILVLEAILSNFSKNRCRVFGFSTKNSSFCKNRRFYQQWQNASIFEPFVCKLYLFGANFWILRKWAPTSIAVTKCATNCTTLFFRNIFCKKFFKDN